ncbi:MAG: pantoate--beta-alanine ligase [Ignavibacteria bacterium]|nr:pantoate--beta-alanine ligase [Ignavibacteria bacterium]
MQVITSVAEMQELSMEMRLANRTIGCVPTMGALHAGHASLIAESASKHSATFVSVFVNPTQFGPTEDFATYTRSLEHDIQVIGDNGGTHVFAPTIAEMYPGGYSTEIHVGKIADALEGTQRPGHFLGVATVVCKLLNAMMPHEAFFGQKDYQQTLVVRNMVRDLLIPVRISIMPTLRESNGLAMSSRNKNLTEEERQDAAIIYGALLAGKGLLDSASKQVTTAEVEDVMKQMLKNVTGLKIEYAVCADPYTLSSMQVVDAEQGAVLLIAVRMGATRLVDNCLFNVPLNL